MGMPVLRRAPYSHVYTPRSAGTSSATSPTQLRSLAPRPLHQGQDARRGRLWFSEDASELTEVANGLPPGIAFEDGVAALHEDENLVEIVTARQDGCAFRVDQSQHELSVRVP